MVLATCPVYHLAPRSVSLTITEGILRGRNIRLGWGLIVTVSTVSTFISERDPLFLLRYSQIHLLAATASTTMDPLAIIGIIELTKRAYDFISGCEKAPTELREAAALLELMKIVLEDVKSNLVENPSSFVHCTTATDKARTSSLKSCLSHCQQTMKKTCQLLKKYHISGHVPMWDRARYSSGGKAEIAECKCELVIASNLLNTCMLAGQVSVIWSVESKCDALLRCWEHQKKRERLSIPPGTLGYSFAVSRFKTILSNYRRRRAPPVPKSKPQKTITKKLWQPKTIMRVGSNFTLSSKGTLLAEEYMGNLMKPEDISDEQITPRTPSPDFNTVDGLDLRPSTPPLHLIRRTSTIPRLTQQYNACAAGFRRNGDLLECWKVRIVITFVGAKGAYTTEQCKRGQLQLWQMLTIFKEAHDYSKRTLQAKDSRVKHILKHKNKIENEAGTGRNWTLAAARVVKRDPGRTGIVTAEKAIVLLVGRVDKKH